MKWEKEHIYLVKGCQKSLGPCIILATLRKMSDVELF